MIYSNKKQICFFLLIFIIISTLFLYKSYSESTEIENFYKEKFNEWENYIENNPEIWI